MNETKKVLEAMMYTISVVSDLDMDEDFRIEVFNTFIDILRAAYENDILTLQEYGQIRRFVNTLHKMCMEVERWR